MYTWNVGNLAHDGVGLTQATTFASTNVTRIRSLSSYYINGKDLVYYGDGGGGAKVAVYDPAAGTETVLLSGLTGGDVMYVKVSGAGTAESYLYVGAEVAGTPSHCHVFRFTSSRPMENRSSRPLRWLPLPAPR